MNFIHLLVHTEYSLVDGIVRVKPLVKELSQQNMPACAVTDHTNVFALVKFYSAAQGAGIKPIIGADLQIRENDELHRVVLLCQNYDGYLNLSRLISKAYTHGQKLGIPAISRAWLHDWNDGLIGLSGGHQGDLGKSLLAGKTDQAVQQLAFWREHFPDRFYLQLQRTGREYEEDYLHAAVNLALDTQTPVVAVNDVRFIKPDDFDAHEVRVGIHDGYTMTDPKRPRRYSAEQYLRSATDMIELFSDIPEAIENTELIAQRCNLTMTLGKNFLPKFPTGDLTTADYLREESRKGLEKRLDFLFGADKDAKRAPYDERLEVELDVIIKMDFPGYFLIVADFIQWAKDHGVPVGPGRGSGAGSLVAYALSITDLDPLQYDLLFERFLNPERVSMPDFDVDFCMEGRDRVIDYVAQHYGREKVSQIITYGSMAAKAVVRDVGRVLGHPYGFIDQIAKLIPFDLGMTLDKALEAEPQLQARYDNEEDVKDLLDMARKLEGITRNAGKHAGGVVISPTALTDFSPLYCEEGETSVVTQFDKNDVESVGLVKFDFLGLRTLTIIDWALDNVQLLTGDKEKINILAIPLDDQASFKLLQDGKTIAVFQLESRGMQEMIKKLKPSCFEDIIALVALYRPGPLGSGMVDDFINRKHGIAKVEYPHPDLEPILKPTYGVILYQEQVMQIAQVLAGYSLGGADLLRRAMGKKKPEEMAKQRDIFMKGSGERDVNPDTAGYIFDLMEKFAGYGFNKSVHSNTQIYTTDGIKSIKDCAAGDKVLSRTPTGESVYSTVVALHDHGLTPLWEIEFDDRTIERCTLDHKWLTEYGQQPLWKIIQMGSKVWGCAAYTTRPESASENLSSLRGQQAEISLGNQMWFGGAPQTGYSRTSETMSCVYEHDSFGAISRQRTDNVLWRSGDNPQESQRAFSELRKMPANSSRNSGADVPRFRTYTRNAPEVFTDGKENFSASRHTSRTGATSEDMARCTSRRISSHSSQSTRLSKKIQNGNVVRTAFNRAGISTQYASTLPERIQTNRLCASSEETCYRSGWSLAFSTHQFRRTPASSTSTGSDAGSGNFASILALNPSFDGMFQRQLWRTYLSRTDATPSSHQRWQLGRDTVLRQPVRATFLGWHQSYDLEVDHPEHNFLLASGLCCSNSHSAAYALVSYQTAWLKVHYPAAFMAAVLSADMDNTDKVVMLIEECRSMKLEVLPPHINTSDYKFTVSLSQDKAIHYGLGAIKGAGEAALLVIVEERKNNGEYEDLFDFCNRIDLRKCNRRVLESLIRAGALDDLQQQFKGANREVLLASLDNALQTAEQKSLTESVVVGDMFGYSSPSNTDEKNSTAFFYAKNVEAWTEHQRLVGEKETLGLYLTGHPIDQYLHELEHFSKRLNSLKPERQQKVKVSGLVLDVRVKNTSRGKMAFITLDDKSARLEIKMYSETYDKHRELLQKDRILVVEGEVSEDRFSGGLSMSAELIQELAQARENHAKQLCLSIQQQQTANALIQNLEQVFTPYRQGKCPVTIEYQRDDLSVKLNLGNDWRVRPDEELLQALRTLLGAKQVHLNY